MGIANVGDGNAIVGRFAKDGAVGISGVSNIYIYIRISNMYIYVLAWLEFQETK